MLSAAAWWDNFFSALQQVKPVHRKILDEKHSELIKLYFKVIMVISFWLTSLNYQFHSQNV